MSVRKLAALLGGGEQKLELGQKPGQVPALFQKPKKLSKKGKKTFNAFKKKFDPSTVANMMGKPLGDTTSYGLTGKNAPKGEKTAKPDIKISPDTIKSLMDIDKANHTKLTEDQGQRMKTGDGVADILAKIVNFMKKSREQVIEQRQISDLLKEEQLAKEKREQDEFLQSISGKNKTSKPSSSGGGSEPGESPLEVKGTNLESASKTTRLVKPETASRIESRNQSISEQRKKSSEDKGSSLLSNITNKVTGLISEAASTVGSLAIGGAAKVGNFLKGSGGTATTAAAIAGTTITGAAGLTIAGETGATTKEGALKKVGQVVPNDPKPGVSSYGIFGINSGGSVQTFVKENPQFNLNSKPGTKQFDDEWKAAASANPEAMYDAQMAWYKKHVVAPLATDLSKVLPKDIASDPRVVVFMADRRNQYGQVEEKNAFSYASNARTPQEFIRKVSEYDAAHIDTAFRTYLQTHQGAGRSGILNRIEKRKNYSLEVDEKTGEKLEKSSKENADGKKDINKSQNSVIINNTQTVLNNRTENRINIFHEPLSTDSSLAMDYQNMAVPYQELKW
jgi:hypothetical protein